MLRSLRARLVLLVLVPLVVTLIVLGIALGSRARGNAESALEERLTAEAQGVAGVARLVVSDPSRQGRLAAATAAILHPTSDAVIFRADDTVVFASRASAGLGGIIAPEVAAALSGTPSRAVRKSPEGGERRMYMAVPLRDTNDSVIGAVRTSAPMKSLAAASRGVATNLAVAGALLSIVTVFIAIWLSGMLQSALARLAAVTKALAGGGLGERAEPPALAEAEPLASAINEMADSLERQVRLGYTERDTLGTIINSMADALLLIDGTAVVRVANPAAVRLFSTPSGRIVGARLMEVVRDHDIARVVHASLSEGRRQSRHLDYGSERRLLNVSATPIRFESEQGVLVLAQDLTELQRLEGTRKEFVANVSHELRTPLASIKAAVETLEGGALQDAVASRDFLARINVEVDHLTEIVQQLLDLSRIESGRAQFDLALHETAPLLNDAIHRVRTQADKNGVSLAVDVPPGLPRVMADGAAIHRVLINLLDNAMKYTSSGGAITISARKADSMVEVCVQDNGAGIASEDLPHVFERFYKADRSRASKGSGLGLALCKHIVQAHGGIMWVESALGKGSAFRFTLPAA